MYDGCGNYVSEDAYFDRMQARLDDEFESREEEEEDWWNEVDGIWDRVDGLS